MKLKWEKAFQNSRKAGASARFPGASDPRQVSQIVLPEVKPRFRIEPGAKVFTIGSCFARNIEEALVPDFQVPTLAFSTPRSEWPARPNGLLNEYNPGTMNQRILFALAGEDYPESTLVGHGDEVRDLALPGGAAVTLERARERRAQIRQVYAELATSDCVFITLGLVECWFDLETNLYLNQMPPLRVLKASGERYEFRRLDVFEAYGLLEPALKALVGLGKKVLLTESPVPLSASFTGRDAVIANEFSKAVLRVCAERLWARIPGLDYFPSYEMVRHGGASAYLDDGVHVRDSVVRRVVQHMVKTYVRAPRPAAIVGDGESEPSSEPAD